MLVCILMCMLLPLLDEQLDVFSAGRAINGEGHLNLSVFLWLAHAWSLVFTIVIVSNILLPIFNKLWEVLVERAHAHWWQ